MDTNTNTLYVIAFFYREKKTERKKIRKIKHPKIGDFVETSDFFSRKKIDQYCRYNEVEFNRWE